MSSEFLQYWHPDTNCAELSVIQANPIHVFWPEQDTLLGRQVESSIIGPNPRTVALSAYKPDTKQEYAVKIPSPRGIPGSLNEAFLQSVLIHPNILRCFGRIKLDTPWGNRIGIAYEYAEEKLEDLFTIDNVPLVKTIMTSTMSAVNYIHENGLLHRDIKPENILIVDGEYKLCDFEFAAFEEECLHQELVVGTQDYMAPETLLHAINTKQSDIHALGVCIYKMLTFRESIWQNGNGEVVFSTDKNRILIGLDELEDDIARVCMRATAFNPIDRYVSVGEMASDLGIDLH